MQQISDRLRLKAAADSGAAQTRYRLGLERDLAGSQSLGLEASAIEGHDGVPDDRRLQVTWTARFCAGSATGTPTSGRRAAGALLEQVARRPAYLPAQVVAKVDTSAALTRLVAVDKTGLPAGAGIDAASGDITVSLGVAVTGIAGITSDAAAFANGGQFALSGNTLVVRPSLIAQPAVADTDTYVVTIDNQGSGTTLVTVVVSRGSVRIDSIVVSAGDNTAPALTSASNLGTSDIGQTVLHTLTFDEAVVSVSVGALPTGMSATASRSGSSVTLQISTTAAFTAFGSVAIPLTVSDGAGNSGVVNVTQTINDVAPVAGGAFAGLGDMTVSDNLGMPIVPTIAAGGVTDPLGRTITYSATGLPVGLSIDAGTGVISGSHDANGNADFSVVMTASNGTSSISKSFTLTIRDEG